MSPAAEGQNPKIIVVIPCLNEIATITKVVGDFMRELPSARILVVDNNSTDGSAQAALATIKKVTIDT